MLTIECTDFINCFRAISDFFRTPPRMDAAMTCNDGQLIILTEGMEIGIPVSGQFEGTAWISGPHLMGLAQIAKKRPPSTDAKIFIVEGSFHVDGTIVPLRRETTKRPPLLLVPKDAPLLFWLGLPHKYTQEEIAGAGLAGLVAKAIRTRDGMVEKAAKHLAPLGISKGTLLEIVEDRIKTGS